MARGADEAAWNRARSLAEVTWAVWAKDPLPRGICEPYFVQPAMNSRGNKLAMAGLLSDLDKSERSNGGGRRR